MNVRAVVIRVHITLFNAVPRWGRYEKRAILSVDVDMLYPTGTGIVTAHSTLNRADGARY